MFCYGDAVGLNKPANNALQQTAAAFLVFRSSLSLSAAAAAERGRSAAAHKGSRMAKLGKGPLCRGRLRT
jgi:hypothetical protein